MQLPIMVHPSVLKKIGIKNWLAKPLLIPIFLVAKAHHLWHKPIEYQKSP